MSETRPLTRRSALTMLGAVGLGIGSASRLLAGPPAFEHGMPGGTVPSEPHPLIGHWLVMVSMASNPGAMIAVPSLFSADGSAMLMFPPVDVLGDSVEFRGPAIGCWERSGLRQGHVTAVQALADSTGSYRGSLTIDSHLSVSDNGLDFTEDGETASVTVRNHLNEVVATHNGFAITSTGAHRMFPGQPGFPPTQHPLDPRTP